MNYKLINSSADLQDDRYKFVVVTNRNISFEECKNHYGENNVFSFPGINTSNCQGCPFVNIAAYRKKEALTSHSHVKYVISGYDLRNFEESNICQNLKELRYSFRNSDSPDFQPSQVGEIREIFFINCKLSGISDKLLANKNIPETNKNIIIMDCFIGKVSITGLKFKADYSFENCKIIHLDQTSFSTQTFVIGNNQIENLTTSTKLIELRNVSLKLFHHRNLDKLELKSDNVKIDFDREAAKNISMENYRGYWNTYTFLRKNIISVSSESLEIEKYIAFFSSRDSLIKRSLLYFHGGYTKVLFPLMSFSALLLINFSILYYLLEYKNDALVTVFYPPKLLQNVIFKDFSFQNAISYWKIVLLVLEALFYYSLFCLSFAIKKIYGFKIEK